jgi:hypothetical protein
VLDYTTAGEAIKVHKVSPISPFVL